MQIRELEIRQGKEFWEWKPRDAGENKWKTTQVPTRPICSRPALCKYCAGVMVNGTRIVPHLYSESHGEFYHVITPTQASHLVAFEYGQAHPGEPFTIGWRLTDEEKQAGKKGVEWPDIN